MPVRARERPDDDQLASIPSFAGLVVLAGSLNPIPSRTRPLNFPAPMVVRLKTRESRSLPGLPRTEFPLHDIDCKKPPRIPPRRLFCCVCSGCRDAIDLDVERSVPGRDADEAARRWISREIARIHLVDGREVRRVGAEHLAFDHLGER